MRRFRFTAVACLLLAGFACAGVGENQLALRVTGKEGLRFKGSYILTSGGMTTTTDLDETVPFDLDLVGTDLSCFLQKLTMEPGPLRVQILIDGEPIAFAITREPFGSVTASTP